MAQNMDKYYKLHHPQYLSEGMQVLREYIHFCQFDFLDLCKRFDQLKDGTIPEKYLREALVMEIKSTQFFFTEANVAQIIKEAPIATNKSIDYKELYNFLKNGPVPQHSFHIYRNSILKAKSATMKIKENMYYDEIKQLFENEISNYFDKKTRFEFPHLNLGLLDIELLASSSQNIIFDDPIQEKLSGFTQLNNQIILDNFEIIIAKKLAINALPQIAYQFIQNEKLELALADYFGVRRNQKMFPVLMKDQFIQLLKVKLYNQELTYDEYSLLYWLIWKKNKFGEFTLKSLMNWVIDTRTLKPKELIKLFDQKNTQIQVIQFPKIFKELMNINTKYGPSLIRETFKPFWNEDRQVNLENLKIVLRSLEIGYNQEQFNEFRVYCANRALFTLSKKTQQILLKVENLIQQLSPDEIAQQEIEISDIEKAYQTFFKSLMLSILEQLNEKAKKYMDIDQYIDEVQFRKIITENYDVDQNSLTMIIKNLERNIEPSQKRPLRQIYFTEIYDKLKSRFVEDLKLPQGSLNVYGKREELEERKYNFEQGQFVQDIDKAFVIQPLDETSVLEKFQKCLIDHYGIKEGTEYIRSEQAIHQFLLTITAFDNNRVGHIQKDLFYEIMEDMFKQLTMQQIYKLFLSQEINYISDFAMGVAKVDDFSFSYMFFCIQLNEYYQTKKLLSVRKY